MSFSQESNRPGVKFLAWWRKQWYFHWSQGCDLLSNFKILNRFLNIVIVFKCTFWTKKRPIVWLNAQICLFPSEPCDEGTDKVQVKWSHCSLPLCKLSSQKPDSSALEDCKWWADIYLGQLLVPYQFICSPTSGFASIESSSLEH